MMEKSRTYQRGETVPIWVETQDWLDNYITPTGGVALLHITDPDGVVKAGHLSVAASASFALNLIVTGGTSGAKGRVMSKPDATTLELQQITGVWQSGETITDTSTGTSTTSSTIASVPMETTVEGYYYYYYTTTTTDAIGWWRYQAKSRDGADELAKVTIIDGGFKLE